VLSAGGGVFMDTAYCAYALYYVVLRTPCMQRARRQSILAFAHSHLVFNCWRLLLLLLLVQV
jgi:hypothetical protein